MESFNIATAALTVVLGAIAIVSGLVAWSVTTNYLRSRPTAANGDLTLWKAFRRNLGDVQFATRFFLWAIIPEIALLALYEMTPQPSLLLWAALGVSTVVTVFALYSIAGHLIGVLHDKMVNYGSEPVAEIPAVIPEFEPQTDNAKLITKIFSDARARDIQQLEQEIAARELLLKQSRSYFDEHPADRAANHKQNQEARDKIAKIRKFYADMIPQACAFLDLSVRENTEGPFRTSWATANPQSRMVVARLLDMSATSQSAFDLGAFASLRATLTTNRNAISLRETKGQSQFIFLDEHPGTPETAIREWLTNTDLLKIFVKEVPYSIDHETRFTGIHIVAPPRRGKTQAMQAMIAADLDLVAQNAGSIVVMNSEMDLIGNIINLKVFADGQPLAGKLIYIEPDVVYPLALNLFAMGRDRRKSYDQNQQEAANNATIAMFEYIFAGLLETDLTSMQRLVFRMAVRACMEMPNATLETLKDLLVSEKGKWRQHANHFSGPVLKFFIEYFDRTDFITRRGEVGWRMENLLTNRSIADMVAAEECKLDLYEELQSSKVVVIHTNLFMLGPDQCEIFGRLFIAMVLRAAQERTFLKKDDRIPTFVYIDECQDYIAKDPNITKLIEQCRKQHVGIIASHQRLTQITDPVLAALSNVGIKLANVDDEADVFAKRLRADKPDDVKLPVGSFLANVRDQNNNKPFVVKVQGGVMERMPRATDQELDKLKATMRKAYCVDPDENRTIEGEAIILPDATPPSDAPPSKAITTRPKTPTRKPPNDPDDVDISPH